MKRLLLLMFIALASVGAQARTVVWDVRAGLGSSQVLYRWTKSMGSMTAYKASIGMTAPLGYTCFMYFPLEYTKKGGYSKELGENMYEATFAQTGFQFGFKIPISAFDLKLRMGPYISAFLGYIENERFPKRKDLDFGGTVAMDLEYSHYILGVEYQYGAFDISKKTDINYSALYVTLGYRF